MTTEMANRTQADIAAAFEDNGRGSDDEDSKVHQTAPEVPVQQDLFFLGSCFFVEVIILLFMAVGADYHKANCTPEDFALEALGGDDAPVCTDSSTYTYAMYQDVHVMILVGFGFLMTFLKKYGYGALSYNLLITVISLQWGMFIFYWIGTGYAWDADRDSPRWTFNSVELIDGDIAAAVVLISFGAVLGRTTPTQLLWMSFFELIFWALNFYICVEQLGIVDVGGSIVVHAFGAYFGLAVSYVLGEAKSNTDDNEASYTSDIFSMVGSLFLWIFWPSFNGFYAAEENFYRDRAFLNTVLSLSACTVATFFLSKAMNNGKFDMVHIQNATLAGGVAVGAAADLYLTPFGACLVGITGAVVSVVGYSVFQDKIKDNFGVEDTCGVHNLHGMPGVLGGVVSAIAIIAAEPQGDKIYYPKAGEEDSHFGKDYGGQAGMQLAAIAMSLGMAIIGGVIVGFFIKKLDSFNPWKVRLYFNDDDNFIVPIDPFYVEPQTVIMEKYMLPPVSAQSGGDAGQDNGARHSLMVPNEPRKRHGSRSGPPESGDWRRRHSSYARSGNSIVAPQYVQPSVGNLNVSGHGVSGTIISNAPSGAPSSGRRTGLKNRYKKHTSIPPPPMPVNVNANIAVDSVRLDVAQPSPLGLLGLAIGSLLVFLSALSATDDKLSAAGPWLITLPGAAQLIAGFVDYWRREIFGATMFTAYGLFWIATSITLYTENPSNWNSGSNNNNNDSGDDDMTGTLAPGEDNNNNKNDNDNDNKLEQMGVACAGYLMFTLVLLFVAAGINKFLFSLLIFVALGFFAFILAVFANAPPTLAGLCLFVVFCLSMYGLGAVLVNEVAGGRVMMLGKPIVDWTKKIKHHGKAYNSDTTARVKNTVQKAGKNDDKRDTRGSSRNDRDRDYRKDDRDRYDDRSDRDRDRRRGTDRDYRRDDRDRYDDRGDRDKRRGTDRSDRDGRDSRRGTTKKDRDEDDDVDVEYRKDQSGVDVEEEDGGRDE